MEMAAGIRVDQAPARGLRVGLRGAAGPLERLPQPAAGGGAHAVEIAGELGDLHDAGEVMAAPPR
jgi:hypothetical protein